MQGLYKPSLAGKTEGDSNTLGEKLKNIVADSLTLAQRARADLSFFLLSFSPSFSSFLSLPLSFLLSSFLPLSETRLMMNKMVFTQDKHEDQNVDPQKKLQDLREAQTKELKKDSQSYLFLNHELPKSYHSKNVLGHSKHLSSSRCWLHRLLSRGQCLRMCGVSFLVDKQRQGTEFPSQITEVAPGRAQLQTHSSPNSTVTPGCGSFLGFVSPSFHPFQSWTS